MTGAGSGKGGARRLGAVGTLVWDRIHNPFAETALTREQWGGAVYSYSALSAACPPGWEVVPIVKIGRDLEAAGRALLGALPNLALGRGVRAVEAANNRVELRYRDAGSRSELQTGGVPPWSFEELQPLLAGLDALYVNYLSGRELDLDTTRRVRASFRGPIFADLHSLFLSSPGDHPRRPRALPRWREWLACFDAIQLNEAELALLAGGHADPEAFALSIPEHGPGLVLVTLGGRGVRWVAREGFPADPLAWATARGVGPVRTGVVPPPTGRLPGDPTGCGDVWGGACIAGLLGGLSLEEAIDRAERMAALKILFPDTGRLHERLRDAWAEEPAC